MNANRTIYGCDCGTCADCRPDLHKKENECVVCGCYNLASFKKLCYTGIHCFDCYYEKYGDSDNEDYCCCCRNPDEGLDGGCPCGCHSDAEDDDESYDDEEYEDLDEEIQCPTCNQSITRGQLIEQDERFCENCWEPEKKYCDECGEQDNSVGLATGENGVEKWVCRFCDMDGSNYNGWGDKDNRECCEMCGKKTSNDEWTDYLGNNILYCDDCYDEHRVRIERKCTGCNFRQSSPDADLCKICDENEIDEEEQRFIDAWKNDDFETCKEMFINKKNACKNRDEIDPEEDYESANCETCGENYLLDKLEVEDDKFYCRLCVV